MRIGIIGRTEVLYHTVQKLIEKGHNVVFIITAKEAPEYTKGSDDFLALSEKLNIPFVHCAKIVKQISLIESAKPDIAISMNYVGIIPQIVIDLFPHGILNAHSGDLPRYRGNACLAWAIMNGEDTIGLCIHRMIGGELDSGDIITRDYLPINLNTKITYAYKWMSDRIPYLFLEALKHLKSNPKYVLEIQSKDLKDALRCYPRKPEDGRIIWKEPAVNILRLINASNKPYVGAFCEFEGEKMIIWDAELVEDQEKFCAIPGQITKVGEESIDVVCGESKLKIKKVEIDGENGVPANWIRSIRKRLK